MRQNDLSLIVAMTTEGVIGRNNALPWRLPSDLARFRELTIKHPVIMGRKNWESLPCKSRPLAGRTNIVMTRQAGYEASGAIVVNSIDDALTAASGSPGADEIFVIGGEQIYALFMPFVRVAYVTTVYASIEGDAHFPKMRDARWRSVYAIIKTKWHLEDSHNTSFSVLHRK